MTRWTIAGLLVGALFFWPGAVEGQKKNKKNKNQAIEATPTEYALLRAQPGAVGKLGSVNASSKAFMLQIGVPDGPDMTAGTNPALAIQSQIKLESLWLQQQRLLAARNPAELAKRMEQLLKAQRHLALSEVRRQAQMFHKSGKSGSAMSKKSPAKEFELEAIDKAVVRMGFLPIRYNDKGGIIEYTPREIDKLRGDKTKPGLAATFDDLQPGQIVRVVFAKQKPAKAAIAKKAKDVEADADAPARPQVVMILILADSNDPLPPEPKKKKKKN